MDSSGPLFSKFSTLGLQSAKINTWCNRPRRIISGLMRLALYVGVLSIAIAPAFAQSQLGTGAISGVVQDASSGVVTGAVVTITNAETGLMRKLVSSAGGQFNAPVLPPGSYQLRVSHPGFSTLEQKDIVVNVGSTATVVAALQVGGVAETVTVQATAIIDT